MLTEDALQGAWQPSGVGEQLVWRNSELAEAVDATRNPRGAVVLLNEANRMSPLVSSFFMTMLAERRLPMTAFSGQSIPIPDNVLFVMDANPGYRGTKAMDEAYVDRFLYKVTFEYDRTIEARFVRSNTLLDIAFEYREQMANGMFDTPFSTRMLKAFVQTASSKRRNIQHALASLLETFPVGEERETLRMRFDVALPTIADELGVTYVA
jgi:MoxR-like ATPase